MSRLLVIARLVLLPLAGMAQGNGKPLNDAALGPSQGGWSLNTIERSMCLRPIW